MFVVPEARRLVQPGQKFGRLTVCGATFYAFCGTNRTQHAVYLCDCGEYRLCEVNGVNRGQVTSCRSCKIASAAIAKTKRSIRDIRVQHIWNGMNRRCTNPTDGSYARYGGRGIYVCDEWKNFDAFLVWSRASGEAPGLQIDRIDNDGPYSPDNCRWVTPRVQANNRHGNRLVTAFGETKTISQWARDPRAIACRGAIGDRLARGWDAESAITKPVRICG